MKWDKLRRCKYEGFQIAHVCRAEKDKKSDIQVSKELYINQCEIGYELPDNTKYEERGV